MITQEQISQLGPVPEDLGGFQNIVTGQVELGDLLVRHDGVCREFLWAGEHVGCKIFNGSVISNGLHAFVESRVYRRMKVAKQGDTDLCPHGEIAEVRHGELPDSDLVFYTPPAAGWPGKETTEKLEASLGITQAAFIPQDDATRKAAPMFRGLLGYFPAALFAVAQHSHESNEKHNPGQPLQWARGKSSDHADCIVRHLIDAGAPDTAGRKYHLRALAWRALALLQEECEAEGAEPGVSSVFSKPKVTNTAARKPNNLTP